MGRNKSKDPIFDFSRLWPLIVGLYATWVLRLAFTYPCRLCRNPRERRGHGRGPG